MGIVTCSQASRAVASAGIGTAYYSARDTDMGSPHGHSCIGRLKGLAELRGVVAGVRAHPASH